MILANRDLKKLVKDESKLLENLTWPEFKQVREKIKTVIVPWGAVEAHGMHLPLSTDILIVEYLAKKVAEKIDALILPTIPVGFCFHASSFPGTVSITQETLMRIAFDIATSLRSNGIQMIIFMSGHGGNVEPLEEIAEDIKDKLDMSVLVVYPFYTDENLIEKFNAVKTSKSIHDIYHAEELETSLVLAISPHLVNMEEAKIEYPEVSKEYLGYKKKLGDLTEYCVFGDSTVASAEKGSQFLEIMVDEILKFINMFEDFP